MRKIKANDVTSISTVAIVVVVVVIIVVAGAAAYYLLTPSGSGTTTTSTTTSSSTTAANTTVVFGASLSLTGSANAFGIEDNWTLHQAVNQINSWGGIPLKNGGYATIKLVILDDQSSDTLSLQNYNTLLTTY